MPRQARTLLALGAIAFVSSSLILWAKRSGAGDAPVQAKSPNFLIILADDMGFADAGCFGGEIATPNLDRLAAGGLRFSRFYNTARCWPSRSSILTGYYAQQIRMDPPKGRLPAWARLLPHQLKLLGYRSYHSGKWHVNGAPKPIADGGFDRSYKLDDHDRHFAPRSHSEDDKPLPPVKPGSGYYTTRAIADHAIRCLKDHAAHFADRPFFEYLAFTAPHFPLQALPEDIARYRDRYQEGWDVIRERRWKRQQALGIVDCALSDRDPDTVPSWNLTEQELKSRIGAKEVGRAVAWSRLTEEQKAFQAAKMAIHAAMIDRMDREIGRVLDQLEAMGAIDDTVILFASDNGASAEQIIRGDGHDPAAAPGSAASYLGLGPGWSTAANTPFRLHKSWVHEGGISTPLIVHWPRGIPARGEIRRDVGHVIDIAPTLLELAGADPGARDSAAPPRPGRSLVAAFARDGAVEHPFLFFSHIGNRALRQGDWKLVSSRENHDAWELYNLENDRCERVNLAASESDRVQRMADFWKKTEAQFLQQAGEDLPKASPRSTR